MWKRAYTSMDSRQKVEDLSKATKLLLSIAFDLRENGVRLSISEIIDSLRLLYTYASLNNYITLDDLYMIIKASLVKKPEYQDIYDEIWKKRVSLSKTVPEEAFKNLWHEVLQRLHTLHTDFGKKITLGRIEDAKNKQDYVRRISSYIELKKAGLIERRGSREYIVPRRKALLHLKRISREYGSHATSLPSLADKLWINEPKGKWDHDFLRTVLKYSELDPDTIRSMSNEQLNKLLSVSNSATSHNRRIIDREIASRLSNGRLEGGKIDNIIDNLLLRKKLALRTGELLHLLTKKPELVEKVLDSGSINYEKLRTLLEKMSSRSPERLSVDCLEDILATSIFYSRTS